MIRPRHRRLAALPRWSLPVLLPPAVFSAVLALRSSDPAMLRGAVLVALLVVVAVMVVFTRSMRRTYRLLAIERAELATSYAALSAERSLEHTAMLEKFAALLRDQADEIEGLRGRPPREVPANLPGVAVLFGAKPVESRPDESAPPVDAVAPSASSADSRGAAASAASLAPATVASGASSESASRASSAAEAEMWPDLAEAPTVVDLLAWDAAVFRRAELRRRA